jgi:hypothetical protein
MKRSSLFAAGVGVAAIVVYGFGTPANALRSIDVESYTDPDYIGYEVRRVVLLAIADDLELRMELEKRIIKELEKEDVVVVRQAELFPPTRQWTPEDIAAIYEREQIDTGIIVVAGASSTSVIPFATQTYSSANVFGNYNNSSGDFYASGISQSTTRTLVNERSTATFSAVTLDIDANRVVWYADVLVKAGGTAFVGLKGDAKGAAKGIVRGLSDDGHINEE